MSLQKELKKRGCLVLSKNKVLPFNKSIFFRQRSNLRSFEIFCLDSAAYNFKYVFDISKSTKDSEFNVDEIEDMIDFIDNNVGKSTSLFTSIRLKEGHSKNNVIMSLLNINNKEENTFIRLDIPVHNLSFSISVTNKDLIKLKEMLLFLITDYENKRKNSLKLAMKIFKNSY